MDSKSGGGGGEGKKVDVKRDLGKVGEPLTQNASELLQKTYDEELDSTKKRLEAKRDLDMKAIQDEIEQELRDFRYVFINVSLIPRQIAMLYIPHFYSILQVK